jgi:hypothetical protein
MNETPCGRCHFYDPLLGSDWKDTGMGWCAKRSVYPFQEGPGQVFPPGAERVPAGELAKPFIVKKGQIVAPCQFVRPTNENLVEKKRQQQTAAIKPAQNMYSVKRG